MRILVEHKIVEGFNKGLRDLNITYLQYARAREGRPSIDEGSIESIVASLSDEELLDVFEYQMCDKYR